MFENHPKDKVQSRDGVIYERYIGSLDKSFKFKYHQFNSYDSVGAFNESTERMLMDTWWFPFIKDDSVIIDAGASYGIYTLASAAAGASKIYAFEPVKVLADSLRENVRLNDWSDRIDISNRLLWSTSGIDVRFDDKSFTTAIKPHDLQNPTRIESVSIDSLNLDRIDLLKIDVEGVELDVLYGAIKTIHRSKPHILIELHSDFQFLEHVKEMLEYFFNVSIQANPTITTMTSARKYMFIEFD